MDTPDQPKLWYETIDEATLHDVALLGGPKQVGHELRPDLLPHKAGEWLSSCLNPDRREKLDINQYAWIWREAKRKGSLVGLSQLNYECECADPVPIEPEDQRAQLLKVFNASVSQLGDIATKLERMGVTVDLKAVK